MKSSSGLTIGIKAHRLLRTVKSEEGFLLVAALALFSVLALLVTSAGLLTDIDIRVSGNFRISQATLQAAIAGTQRAKDALRQETKSSSDPASFNDELTNSTRDGADTTRSSLGVKL